MKKDEFQKLQKLWYGKLADTGFVDIERFVNGEMVIRQFSCSIERQNKRNRKAASEEYYKSLYFKAHHQETCYKNEADRYILQMFSNGIRIKEIVEHLVSIGLSRDRKNVRLIIRRYEMKWNLKSYNDKQLCRDRRKKS